MGKNQHQKDRMHVTSIEWRRDFGGFKNRKSVREIPLGFDCCTISLTPFKNPVCTSKGVVFDKKNLKTWLKTHKNCPLTGEKIDKADLFALKFHRNGKGLFHCPITFKVFTEHSHIAAVRPSGNVFSFEAIKKLNFDADVWEDVLTGERFGRNDVVTIQDPHNLEPRKIENFAKNTKTASNSPFSRGKSVKSNEGVKTVPKAPKFTGKRLPKNALNNAVPAAKKNRADAPKTLSEVHSEPFMAASFTCTAVAPECRGRFRELTATEERYRMYGAFRNERAAAFGAVRLHTALGEMAFALDAKLAPETSHNFLQLARSGRYDGTPFHRVVRGFMAQGGDPEGTGFGGESAFGGKFRDEITKALKHDSRGILSMANSGPNTNGSQFFITFGDCPNLDGKHNVFGKLVDGMQTLNRIELVKTDPETDQPIETLVLEKVTVLVDPFEKYENDQKELSKAKTEKSDDENSTLTAKGNWFSGPSSVDELGSVGKYLRKALGN